MIEYYSTGSKFHTECCRFLKRAKDIEKKSIAEIDSKVWPCRQCLPEMAAARMRSHVRSSWHYVDWLNAVMAGSPYA